MHPLKCPYFKINESLEKNREMVNIIFDIGNTLIKLGIYHNQSLLLQRRFKNSGQNIQQIAVVLNDCTKKMRAIVSSVIDIPTELLNELKKRNIQYLIFDDSLKLPIINKYETPQTLGKDRLAGVIGARQIFLDSNILVIDAGTAITYDIITDKKEYLGGTISPGLNLRFRALNSFTGKLPLVEPQFDVPLFGKNTYEAIRAGVQNGILYEMNEFIHSISKQFRDLKLIITGGDAFYFDNKLKKSIFAEPNLVLLGLNRILEYNA